MKRGRIGSTDVDLSQYYWTDGRPEWDLRLGEKTLFAKLDMLQSEADITVSAEEDNAIYNRMDLVWVQLLLSFKYGNNKDELLRAGYALTYFVDDGAFDNVYSDMDERNDNVMQIFAQICKMTESDDVLDDCDAVFLAEYKRIVVDYAYYWDDEKGCSSETPVEIGSCCIASIGDKNFTSFSEIIKFTGSNYGYVNNYNDVKDHPEAKKKMYAQVAQLKKIAAKSGNTPEALTYNVSSGVTTATASKSTEFALKMKNKTLAFTPEYKREIEDATGKKLNGIGEPASAIIGLVTAIIGLLSIILGTVLPIIAQKKQMQYFADNASLISEEAAEFAPEYADFEEAVNKRKEALQRNKTVMGAVKYGGIAAVLFIAFSMFRRR